MKRRRSAPKDEQDGRMERRGARSNANERDGSEHTMRRGTTIQADPTLSYLFHGDFLCGVARVC